MPKINIKNLFPTLVLMLASSAAIAEEVVYLKSSEPCQVEAYPAPEASPLAKKYSCGLKSSLLERRGPIMNVKIGDDEVIWVAVKDTTTDVPAELEVLRLTAYQKKIEAELDQLNEQVKKLSETSTKLINALMAAEAAKINEQNNNKEDSR